jgi:hypothetical protein
MEGAKMSNYCIRLDAFLNIIIYDIIDNVFEISKKL